MPASAGPAGARSRALLLIEVRPAWAGSQALQCAIEIQQSLAEHRRADGFAPGVQIGVCVGEVSVSDGSYSGLSIDIAARIGRHAHADEILTTRQTVDQADRVRTVVQTVAVELEGTNAPVEIVKVQWQTATVTQRVPWLISPKSTPPDM